MCDFLPVHRSPEFDSMCRRSGLLCAFSKAAKAGAEKPMTKPMAIRNLFMMVHELLAEEQALQPRVQFFPSLLFVMTVSLSLRVMRALTPNQQRRLNSSEIYSGIHDRRAITFPCSAA
jgi:hypothetical protein